VLHKLTGLSCDLIASTLDYSDICGKQCDWLLLLAALDRVESVNGLWEVGVSGESIDRVGRDHRDAAGKQNLCGGLKPFFVTLYNSHLLLCVLCVSAPLR